MQNSVSDTVTKFFNNFPTRKYHLGEKLIRAGETPTAIYWLGDGLVKQSSLSATGVDQTLTIYKPGTFFPISQVFHPVPSQWDFEAILESQVTAAPLDQVKAWLQSQPEVTYSLLGRVYSGLDAVLLRLEASLSGDATSKVALALVLMTRRFGTYDMANQAWRLTLHVTETELAAQAGVARETVSRVLKKLKTSGIVQHQAQQWWVRDLKELEKQAGLAEL